MLLVGRSNMGIALCEFSVALCEHVRGYALLAK